MKMKYVKMDQKQKTRPKKTTSLQRVYLKESIHSLTNAIQIQLKCQARHCVSTNNNMEQNAEWRFHGSDSIDLSHDQDRL